MGLPHRLPIELAEDALPKCGGQSRAWDLYAVHGVPGVSAPDNSKGELDR